MKRHLEFIKNVLKSNFSASRIYKLNFALTYKCNERCANCNIWKIKSRGELGLNEIGKFFKKNQFSWINLTGGEIFLRNDIDEIFRIIAENNRKLFILTLTTNGLLTKKIIKSVRGILKYKIPFFMVTVSIDGKEDIYNRIRGVNAFKMAKETFLALREIEGLKTEIGYTIFPENLGRLGEFIEYMRKEDLSFSANNLHVNTYNVSEHFYGNNKQKKFGKNLITKTQGELKLFLSKYKKGVSYANIGERAFQKFELEYLKTRKNPLKCRALSTSIFLDSYGNIYPCIIWNKPLGNIKDFNYSLENIVKAKNYASLIKSIEANKCPNCWTVCEGIQTMLGNLFSPKFVRNAI